MHTRLIKRKTNLIVTRWRQLASQLLRKRPIELASWFVHQEALKRFCPVFEMDNDISFVGAFDEFLDLAIVDFDTPVCGCCALNGCEEFRRPVRVDGYGFGELGCVVSKVEGEWHVCGAGDREDADGGAVSRLVAVAEETVEAVFLAEVFWNNLEASTYMPYDQHSSYPSMSG